MAVPGLDPIATGMNGRIDFYDNGIATTGLRARLGTLDAIATGGLYGFDRKTPIFRLGIAVVRAPLGEARDLFSFARRLPLRGDGRIETLLEGDVPRPVIITRVTAPSAAYASFPIADLDGRVYVYNGVVCVGGTHARYDGLDVDAGGTIESGDVATSDLVVAVRGPAARVPYAAQIARGSTLHAVGRIAGAGLKLDAIGTLATDARGSANGATLAGLFHIDPQGDGAFGPLLATRPDGSSLAGTFYLDREHSASAFWLDARRYAFASLSPAPRFPGLALAPPEFDGTLDGSVAGSGPPSDFRIAGHVHAQGLRVGTLALGDVGGDVTGHIGNLRVGNVLARGAWGTLAGRGAYVGTRLAIAGTYRGSFDRLRAFTGELGARGPLSGPVSLLIDPKTTVVQARSVDTPGARVRGVPVDSLGGTVAVTATRVHIYAAHADIAGARFAAAGTLAIAKGGAEPRGLPGVGVSIADADARRLHAVAPVDGGGRIATIGTFRSDGAQTRYDGGVALAGAHVQRIPVAGNGDIGLRGTRLTFSQTTALAGGAVAALAGSLGGLDTKRPRYDATVALSETPLGPIARAFAPRRHDIAGTIAGHFAVRGSADDLEIRGRLAMPEGAFNGLSFRDASANITIAPGGVGARAGTITVGSTVTRFGGFFRGGDGGVRVDAPQADLSDFNDLFDTGDTLGGKGHIAVRFLQNRGVVRSNADIGIAALKFKTFDLGDAVAQWSSRGQNVTGTLGFGGRSGRLDIAGTLGLATHSPLDKLLERSRFNGNAQLRGLDLGVWLPALGYQLPITGRVDADTRIAGLLRKPDVRTSAKLVNGTIGKLPVNSFTVVASSTLSRTTIQSLELNVPSLSLTGSGSFGLGPKDSVALRLHAKSGNVGALSGELLGAAFPVTGTAEADVGVDGTRASPRVAGGFDVERAAFRGIAVPQALGEFSIRGRDLVLSDVEVGFATGTLYVAGSLPLQLAPFAFGPAQAPIELDLTAKNIDMADFAPLFPAGSTLKGMLGGRVAIAGTAGKPELDGSIALTNGAASTPLETVPITNLRGTLAFERTSVALRELHAEAGGGSLDASGSVTLADLVDLGADANYRFDAKARALRLSLPAYGSGQIDGTLSLRHARGSARTLAGALNLNDATIPFAALLLAAGPGTGDQIDATPVVTATAKPGNLALDLDVAAERNVRVRSANVDIGGRGTLHVGGTFGAPKLDGGFDSTGGTLTYFNTVFRVIDGRVSFRPDQGVIPTLTAHAETHVINPDPNSVRNTSGSADVTLDIHGPVTGLTIGLTSDPAYDRQQVLGLLLNAPALGATDLFDTPGQATLYGSTSTSAQSRDVSVARTTSFGQTTVAQEAFGVANAQFTRTLLAPAETTFANAVGLTNFNVNVDLTGNVGFQARKVLGKEVSAVYGTTIGYPYRQTFGFELKPNVVTAAQVTVFQTYGNAGLSSLNPGSLTPGFGTARLTSAQPSTGTVGFSVSLQRLFP
jgi:autotransporter translocation and assembly factor TamB